MTKFVRESEVHKICKQKKWEMRKKRARLDILLIAIIIAPFFIYQYGRQVMALFGA
jgi:accessory gene regulator protein AgrB